MMFSERLEHGKYDFHHLQGTVRVRKPAQFRGFSEDHPQKCVGVLVTKGTLCLLLSVKRWCHTQLSPEAMPVR